MASLGLINARIWTADRSNPWADCLRAEEGTIRSIGDERDARGADRVIDCGGRFVSPGLIDTHTHFVMGGESLGQLDLSRVRSRGAFEEAIEDRASNMEGSEWLIAHGWHDENWGGGMPERSWLRSAGERPCVAYRMDSHVCVVNDSVLRLIDVPDHDPPGGRIGRDARGAPNGLFYESAAWEIINPAIPPLSISAKRQAAMAAQTHAHELGLTTMGSMEYARTVADVLDPIRDELSIRLRITLLDRTLPIDFSFAESFENDDHLAVIGFKAFLDGTLGARTAKMLRDYDDDPGNDGLWVELAASGELQAWFDEVRARGFQPAMHAIGDAAVRLALDVVARVPRLDPKGKPCDRATGQRSQFDQRSAPARLASGEAVAPSSEIRPRIEHAQQIDPADLPRFAGVIASMQPLHRADDGRFILKRVGRDRLPGFFPFRSLLDSGATLAFGSDWPIVTCDPMPGIRAAVTGLTLEHQPVNEDETILIDDVLRAYTIDAAGALRFDHRAGRIAHGMLADLAVWDRDPFRIDWSNDPLPRIVRTMVGGRVVFEKELHHGPSSP